MLFVAGCEATQVKFSAQFDLIVTEYTRTGGRGQRRTRGNPASDRSGAGNTSPRRGPYVFPPIPAVPNPRQREPFASDESSF